MKIIFPTIIFEKIFINPWIFVELMKYVLRFLI